MGGSLESSSGFRRQSARPVWEAELLAGVRVFPIWVILISPCGPLRNTDLEKVMLKGEIYSRALYGPLALDTDAQ